MHFLLDFIERWVGPFSGILLTFLGVMLCVLAISAYWDRWIRWPGLLLGGAAGLSLVFRKTLMDLVTNPFVDQSIIIALIIGLCLAGCLISLLSNVRAGQSCFPGKCATSPPRTSLLSEHTNGRTIRGSRLGVPLVIGVSALAVLATGLSTPQVMVGDEVTHYYMLTTQAEDLNQPNFFADIPMATGEIETRRYPHSFLWHYLGAVLYHLSGDSFAAVQLYQALFFVQLLLVGYLLARSRQGVESRSALVYVLTLASLPLTLIFSVTFYQDVPLTAQILTAFYLLRHNRWFFASLFMAFAIGLKVTAVLFFPAFFLLLAIWQIQRHGWTRGMVAGMVAATIVLGSSWGMGRTIAVHANGTFYPQEKIESLLKKAKEKATAHLPNLSKKTGVADLNTNLSASYPPRKEQREVKAPIIANHPGDLRIKENFLVYGGVVLWLVVAGAVLGACFCRMRRTKATTSHSSSLWLYAVGLSYILLAGWFIRTSPDARFFLPGLPFLLLPLSEKLVCLPKPKLLVSILAALAFLQGGYVLEKTYRLRALTPEMLESIQYLEQNPPSGKIFMYPEGNYRFFPAQHEWYLGYRLRQFWRGDNDERIRLLHRYKISHIVIKKHLIAPVDEKITNLGVYPTGFVQEIEADPRFTKVFANEQLIIFQVPFSSESVPAQ